jgi:HK97 family phage portal protein
MEPAKTTIKRIGGKKVYQFRGKSEPYPAADVIDTPFLLKPDQLGSYSPLSMASDVLNLAIAMRKYGSGFFAGGGVPPLALEGPLPQGADALQRAMNDVHRVIEAARKSGAPIFPMPPGHALKAVGLDPEKGQMTGAMRFVNEELGRIWTIPPVFIGDLTNGTFTNTEQQDLQLVKHHFSRRAKAFEEELNLKLFRPGRGARRYVEHNLDGVLRGDLLARMDALGKAVNSALLMPNEARALDNRPSAPGGGRLYIQGATVPLEQAGQKPTAPQKGD